MVQLWEGGTGFSSPSVNYSLGGRRMSRAALDAPPPRETPEERERWEN